MPPNPLTARQKVLLAAPPVLLASTLAVFRLTAGWFGAPGGYLTGFLFYWLVWCLLLPLWALGRDGLRGLFRRPQPAFGRPAWLGLFFLVTPVVVAGLTLLPSAAAGLTQAALAVSILFGLANGTLEEVFWRGTYTRIFPDSWLWGVLYPALGFGFWHLAPQSLFPYQGPGGAFGFVLQAVVLGLVWGWLARKSGSIRWLAVAHITLNWFGLVGSVLVK